MFFVRVEAEFAAAHFLSHYHGKCENLHGHNYRVRVWVRGAELDSGGMLVDFGVLKQTLRELIAGLDHTNLNDRPEFQNDPSAERIARYIFQNLEALFQAVSVDPRLLWAVDVYETPSSMARYTRDN
ncbi:MAG: 6-carboxytetrahydropterin synthase QueD [Spirochaetaceae bacterium]|jgi:6-pyruvoyltetrahydropterin/6-carboxytetrahydropterin synthase|nr:6-carboxytetrahydropterin synthase QueD [Spirochaetaceae bacterium]